MAPAFPILSLSFVVQPNAIISTPFPFPPPSATKNQPSPFPSLLLLRYRHRLLPLSTHDRALVRPSNTAAIPPPPPPPPPPLLTCRFSLSPSSVDRPSASRPLKCRTQFASRLRGGRGTHAYAPEKIPCVSTYIFHIKYEEICVSVVVVPILFLASQSRVWKEICDPPSLLLFF